MDIIKLPPSIHTAFNPAVIELSGTEEYATITIRVNGNDIISERELFDGIVLFDISSAICQFKDEVIKLNRIDDVYIDNNLQLTYLCICGNIVFENKAINAAVQIGENSDLTLKQGTFRTEFERLITYDGYPMNITILGKGYYYGHDDIMNNKVDEIYYSVPIYSNKSKFSIKSHLIIQEIKLETNTGVVITNNLGEIIYIGNGKYTERIIPLETRCIPDSPFYVRWINQLGGWDYWMFSHRQYRKRNVTDIVEFKPFISDQLTAKGTDEVISLVGEEKITVGASGLTENQYDVISKLIYSPRIDYYDGGVWKKITIDKGETEKDTRMKTQSLEFTFKLPDIQLQF